MVFLLLYCIFEKRFCSSLHMLARKTAAQSQYLQLVGSIHKVPYTSLWRMEID